MKNNINILISLTIILLMQGCTSERVFNISTSTKICVPNNEVVTTEISNGVSEVTVHFENPVIKDLHIYAHFKAKSVLTETSFGEKLEELILNNESVASSGDDLVKLQGESAGVFHLFSSVDSLSIENYKGSCFTISDEMGECTFISTYPSYQVDVDFDVKHLNVWSEILESVNSHLSTYECQ